MMTLLAANYRSITILWATGFVTSKDLNVEMCVDYKLKLFPNTVFTLLTVMVG